MNLIVTTPSGTALLFDVCLTGKLDYAATTPLKTDVAAVEITIMAECVQSTSTGTKDLTAGGINPRMLKVLWVKPRDLCDQNGSPYAHDELIEAAERQRIALANYNPLKLPDNWP